MDLQTAVAHQIKRFGLLNPGQPVLVAVSGGPDSLALAHVLSSLAYSVEIAHFDHGLRLESAEEAAFVERTAREWGVPFHSGHARPGELQESGSVEAAAREARYAFLLRVATDCGLSRVAVGHTLDDQAETVLMHFLRGSGPRGLAGMRPSRPLSAGGEARAVLIRPLLATRRADIEAYCRRYELEPRQDPSNEDLAIHRNWLRHELIPTLERVQPNLPAVLARNAELMGWLADLVDDGVEVAWGNAVMADGEDEIALGREALRGLPAVIQGELLRTALDRLRPDGPQATFEEVDRLRKQVVSGDPPRQELAGGLRASTSADRLIVRAGLVRPRSDLGPQLDVGQAALPDEGIIPMAGTWAMVIERRPLANGERAKIVAGVGGRDRGWRATLDAARICGELTVRTRRPGDRMRPLGMSGTVRLSNLFTNEKVVRELRNRWPIVVDDEKVCWVPGLRLSDEVAVRESTSSVIDIVVSQHGVAGT
jgi:tRNA(Ile)-lysidine synthase